MLGQLGICVKEAKQILASYHNKKQSEKDHRPKYKGQNHTITKEKHHFKTLRKGNIFVLNIIWKNNGKMGRLLSKIPLRKWKGNKLKENICKIYDKRPTSIILKEPLKFNEDNRPNKKMVKDFISSLQKKTSKWPVSIFKVLNISIHQRKAN